MSHTRAEMTYFNDSRRSCEALESIAKVLSDTLPALVEVLGSTEPRAVTLNTAASKFTMGTWQLGAPQPAFQEHPADEPDEPPYEGEPDNGPDYDPATDWPGWEDRLPRYRVFDVNSDDTAQVVGHFMTMREAGSCVIGLEYLDPAGAKADRFQIELTQNNRTRKAT